MNGKPINMLSSGAGVGRDNVVELAGKYGKYRNVTPRSVSFTGVSLKTCLSS